MSQAISYKRFDELEQQSAYKGTVLCGYRDGSSVGYHLFNADKQEVAYIMHGLPPQEFNPPRKWSEKALLQIEMKEV